jgi:hypothetical protein
VELPIGPLIKSLTNATIGVWVRWTGATEPNDTQYIFEFGTSGNCYMYLSPGTGSGGPMRFVIRSPLGGTEEVVTATSALGSGWHHVAVTIDSENSKITLILTVNIASKPTSNKLSYMGDVHHYVGRSGDTFLWVHG